MTAVLGSIRDPYLNLRQILQIRPAGERIPSVMSEIEKGLNNPGNNPSDQEKQSSDTFTPPETGSDQPDKKPWDFWKGEQKTAGEAIKKGATKGLVVAALAAAGLVGLGKCAADSMAEDTGSSQSPADTFSPSPSPEETTTSPEGSSGSPSATESPDKSPNIKRGLEQDLTRLMTPEQKDALNKAVERYQNMNSLDTLTEIRQLTARVFTGEARKAFIEQVNRSLGKDHRISTDPITPDMPAERKMQEIILRGMFAQTMTKGAPTPVEQSGYWGCGERDVIRANTMLAGFVDFESWQDFFWKRANEATSGQAEVFDNLRSICPVDADVSNPFTVVAQHKTVNSDGSMTFDLFFTIDPNSTDKFSQEVQTNREMSTVGNPVFKTSMTLSRNPNNPDEWLLLYTSKMETVDRSDLNHTPMSTDAANTSYPQSY